MRISSNDVATSFDFAAAAKYQQSPPRDLTWELPPRRSGNERHVDSRIQHHPIGIVPTEASLTMVTEAIEDILGS